MDYNRSNRGIVCFFYNLIQKRTFFLGLTILAGVILACLKFTTSQAGYEFNAAFYGLCVLCVSLLFIALSPRIFIVKLIGLLFSLIAIFATLHNLNKLESPLFYALLLFGAFILHLLLSWFVYNARSNEVNDL